MSMDALKLDNQLCFALYACSRQITRLYKPLLDPLGLTYTQYIVLLVLWEQDGQTVKQLGERLYLDSGTLTPLLKKMAASGVLRRTRSGKDERSVIIRLTEQGKALKHSAAEIPYKMASCVNLPLEDAQALHRILYGFLNSVC